MKQLETNEFLILNSIIYNIYSNEDFNEMREEFFQQLKMLIDFDSADFFIAPYDGSEGLIEPVAFNCDAKYTMNYDEIDYSRGILYGGRCMVYKETDIISDDVRTETDYYKKVYIPNRWHYSMQMILAKDNKFMGVVTLYRVIGKQNFEYDDIFMLDLLKEHMAYRISQYRRKEKLGINKITVTEATKKYMLTKREESILRLLMQGQDNYAISENLVITVNTLKKHILNIYRKLGINNRVQLFKMVKELE